MKPKLKVSGITDLHDGRYCAAVGITLLGFTMDRASEGRMNPEFVKEISDWLSGPELIGEYGYDSPDEINSDCGEAPLAFVSLPGDYRADFAKEIKAQLIFRMSADPEAIRNHSLFAEESVFFEIDGKISDVSEWQGILDRCLIGGENPAESWPAFEKAGMKPMAYSLGDYFRESEGGLDYEKCDALVEEFALAHLA